MLTQRLPDRDRGQPSSPHLTQLAEPFREIIEHCLKVDAKKRWTVAQILARLEPDRPVSAATPAQTAAVAVLPAIPDPAQPSPKWLYVLAMVALLTLAVFLIARPKRSSHPAEVPSPQTQQGAAPENTPSATSQPAQGPPYSETKPSPLTAREAEVGHEKVAAPARQSDVVHRAVPQVSPSARRSIQGTIKVRVKLKVDAAGDVTDAKFESAGSSKYFSRLALQSAREWKFAPAEAGESATREWTLQFAFSRGRTEASAARTKR